MKSRLFVILAVVSLILAACAPEKNSLSAAEKPLPTKTVLQPVATPTENLPDETGTTVSIPIQTEVDQQGAVEVSITPEEPGTSTNALNFDVALNTHSVDLSMDLAKLATLTTDTGVTVRAVVWDAPRGGHHVSGTLVFPAESSGQNILNGAKSITIVIQNLDAPERVFTWNLGG